MKKEIDSHSCNERTFARIYEQYASLLHNFIYYKFGQHLNPSDKVQEAFIKLWEHCKKVPPSKAKSFLFTTASNMTLNDIKHEKVKLNYQKRPQTTINSESPEFLLEEKEYLVKYQRALGNLTVGQREVFLLNRIDGKKHKEIAALLGISTKAVEKRLYKALENLRKDIENIP